MNRPPSPHRYRLHRAGIRNVWQYETGEVPDIEEWLAAAGELQPSDASGYS